MFKLNSTTVFPLAELNDSINGFMIDYTSNHKFSKEINVMLQSLTDTKEDQILKELKYLEKRDIIEMKTIDSVTGYIYVV
jgi:membrane-bound lytic murein transglycosylase MltF